ncbi:MAG: hypothetical protein MZV64_15650 [Ignavibacteriales bacterium]|nr:hypothetical protein [Ignavibacteriales bacterium]
MAFLQAILKVKYSKEIILQNIGLFAWALVNLSYKKVPSNPAEMLFPCKNSDQTSNRSNRTMTVDKRDIPSYSQLYTPQKET